MKWSIWATVCLGLGLLMDFAIAAPQDDPSRLPLRISSDPDSDSLQDDSLDLEAEVTTLDLPEVFNIRSITYQGSTVYSDAELDQVTGLSQIQGQDLSLPELLQLVSAITNRYVEDGYITSGAFLPLEDNSADSLATGQLTIQILEGQLESINLEGLGRLRPSYVRSRLARGTQTPLNQQTLLQTLQLLQLDPLIDSLNAELATGTQPGTSILNVRLTEARTFEVGANLDNGRSPSVGSFRRSVTVTEANALGFGDRISVDYANTTGSDRLEASYDFPLNALDGSLQLRYSTSANRIIEDPFDAIDIRSPSELFEITYRQPLILKPDQEFALGLTGTYQESETTLLGIPFPDLSSGSDDQGRTRVSAVRFFQDYRQQGEQSVLAGRSQFNLGLDILDANVSRDGSPDSQFFSWRGQLQYVRLTAPNTLLVIRSDVQLANQELLPLEQFGLGGQQTVRGYRQDALITDNGALVSVEYRLPLYQARSLSSSHVLQLVPFLDWGVGWNASDNLDQPRDNTLLGTGLGLLWQQGDRFSFRLDYGIPLTEGPSDRDRTWQENGLYFSIQTSSL